MATAIKTPEEQKAALDQASEEEDLLKGAQQALDKAREEGKIDTPRLDGYRAFVAPIFQNGKKLIKAGETVQIRDPNSATGFRDASRQGDVWVEFVGGMCVTKDPVVQAWCDANTDICRDVEDPQTAVWYELKLGQVPLAWRDALPFSIDIDAALAGRVNVGEDHNLVRQGRQFARQANERAEGS